MTPPIDRASATNPVVEYYMCHHTTYFDKLKIQVSIDGGEWIDVPNSENTVKKDGFGSGEWEKCTVALTDVLPADCSSFRVAFTTVSAYGYNIIIDAVRIFNLKGKDLANNASDEATVAMALLDYTPATNLVRGEDTAEGLATISWTPAQAPEYVPLNIFESFEDFENDFTGPFTGFVVLDLDNRDGGTYYSASGSLLNIAEQFSGKPAGLDGTKCLGVTFAGSYFLQIIGYFGLFCIFLKFFCKNICRNEKSVVTLHSQNGTSRYSPPRALLINGAVVQLVRIQACHAWGRGFESRPHRQRREENEKQLIFGLLFSFFFCVPPTHRPARRCPPLRRL